MRRVILLLFLTMPCCLHAQSPPPRPSTLAVTDYGAVCDGVHDDTAGFRAAIVAADTSPFANLVYPSHCMISDTLVFGGRTDRYSTISMTGPSEYLPITYIGPQNRPALFISHMAAFTWRAVGVISGSYGDGTAHGTSVGVLLDGPFGSGGTVNTTITFDHLAVSGFNANLKIGGGDAASEIDCRQCTFSFGYDGVQTVGYNTLNLWFYGSHWHHNLHAGVEMGTPGIGGGVHVVGGDTNNNLFADFNCASTFGVLSLDNIRAEVPAGGRFVTAATPNYGCQTLVIRNSTIIAVGATTDPSLVDLIDTANVTIEDSDFQQGMITAAMTHEGTNHYSNSAIRIARTFVELHVPSTTLWPLTIPANYLSQGTSGPGLRLDFSFNTIFQSGQGLWGYEYYGPYPCPPLKTCPR